MIELDIRIFRFLHHSLSGQWILPMVVLSAIGGGWGSLAVVPLLASTRRRRFAAALAAVLGVTAVNGQIEAKVSEGNGRLELRPTNGP